ncbi:hypothetical protein CHS0354_020488 [Potamilus streckersoni]|uniref:ABC-2 type transporter transmembrane domain-containing protein n=1 Tax=Potamilus streckersoni TaxID=2493646 RepID=A0AAE0W5C1_9BIVA|nr:hypothetical protein CHS0354_020488 [Potamilus streckersoni]
MKVINKERNYKLYRVSAFCFAKTFSEFPLSIIQPVVYICVIYWVANLNGTLAFLGSVGVLVIDVFAAQSIGLFVGAAVNPPWTLILVSLGLLSMMLFGGAFATPPVWLQWAKYVSYFFYGLNALIHLEFKEAAPIPCDPTMSLIPICSMVDPTSNSTMTHFPSDVVLLMQNISWPLWNYIFVLFVVMVVMRLLWYIVLRRKNPQG